jgi:hypothetical protein
MIAPQSVKMTISAIVTAQSALGKSLGFSISAMKLGSVIWPTKVYKMLRKALIPETYVVPGSGKFVTIGSDPAMYPAGWSWMPTKMMARRTAMPIVTAEKVPRCESELRVRGREMKKHRMALIALKATVHAADPDRVLRSLAPTRQ